MPGLASEGSHLTQSRDLSLSPSSPSPRIGIGGTVATTGERYGADRVNLATPGQGEEGRGRRRGSPASGEEPARASRVPLAGAEGFPRERPLTFARSPEHEGLAPLAARSGALMLRRSSSLSGVFYDGDYCLRD
ncbi:uncharacterized protein LOC117719972 isoform X2 [Arvicanthis niloticus]|uniref:uncharacterized protein LOC117719972 isoform X2 n=1 Tax=Arvicanthis niloticus TaxID=61156 RepID=UPI00403C7C40